MPPSVIFYISGHGFGHAIRQIAIINALHELTPSLPIVVRTAAPEWLFTRTTCGASLFLPGETDTGVVQIDSLRLDVAESVRRARAFLDRFDELVEREAAIIRANDVRLVIVGRSPAGVRGRGGGRSARRSSVRTSPGTGSIASTRNNPG